MVPYKIPAKNRVNPMSAAPMNKRRPEIQPGYSGGSQERFE
jgi:hypothetical protein